jgi:hypothetical protein
MSDTLRTDQVTWTDSEAECDVVSADFARELERELNALRAMNAQLQVDLEQRDKDYENLQALM